MRTLTRLINRAAGDLLEEATFGPITPEMLIDYATASLDTNPIHIDSEFARKSGLDDVIVHGMLGMAQFGEFVMNLAPDAQLETLSTRFKAIVPVGSTLRIFGTIASKQEKKNGLEMVIDLEAKVEGGPSALRGKAVLMFDKTQEPTPPSSAD